LELGVENKKFKCPACHTKEGVGIVYGYPSEAALKAWQNKEIELGGCIINDDDPKFKCLKCGHLW